MYRNKKLVKNNCITKRSICPCNQSKSRFPLKPQRRISAINTQINNANMVNGNWVRMNNALKSMATTIAALQRENVELKAKLDKA